MAMEKKSKEVKMKDAKQEEQKLPYEQLEQVALQLRNANNDLYKRLQNAQQAIAEFNEIGMLLDILGKSEYFSDSFVSRCAAKIEEIVTKALDASEKEEKEVQTPEQN